MQTHEYIQTDRELEECLRELMANSRFNYSDITVSVDAQNVHFAGTLSDEPERHHLTELANMVQGIGKVFNEVTLKH